MFAEISDEFVARIPPEKLDSDYESSVLDVTRRSLEGKLVDLTENDRVVSKCYVVRVTSAMPKGEGTIVHGDGAVYQTVEYRALAFEPRMQEVLDGLVVSVQKFGAFVRIGPFDGLLHISQIMDDRIDIDLGNQRFIGKDTKRDVRVGDKVRVRIVAMNLSSASVEESKIGLTMKQVGLGKLDWLKPKKIKQ
ncbi:MAG: DNA-directed RNA polymerase [Candidatus Thermoplasmatota archaeon]|nr:DNA-directed RNA polymerase [Candidatus Thermoplasmatota archaeon]MCL5665356.1 DNA-directed RNA polymerase [Candidatus Thermoplasmatota archaeon]